ncbi:MAG: acyl-CoA desaturase [Verrucomicrobiaceae bacterium]|nr:acyl-CoA desaturase [Verrucomicrobiaceae bacterium]
MSNMVTKPPIMWLPAGVLLGTLVIALTIVPWYGAVHGYSWGNWLAFTVILAFNGFSITAGYHRLFAHNTYKAHPLLKWFFALFGASATQNSILVWCSGHRRHHRHVDDNDNDPYSAGRGLFFSHIGWMLRDYPTGKVDFSNVPDLQRDPIIAFQHRHYALLAVGMNLAPPLLLGFATGDVWGYLLIAGFLRLVVNHHVTFFINSLAHYWGKQPYTDENSARDNFWLALVTYGEGYHNFHHLFQTDYRNGVRWWQFDPTKWLINVAHWFGLARDLSRVPDFKIQKALLDMQFKRAQASLASATNADAWREHLEREYQHFLESLHEWNNLRQQWYEQKRTQLAEKTAEIQQRWRQTTISSRLQELEYALKLQRKRLHYLTLQFA